MATRTSAEIRRLARNGVITARRMRAVGWTRGEVRSLQRRERLFPAHAGVFYLHAEPARLAVWTAAVARCGDEARLSHWSAAALWQLVKRDEGWPHVTVPRNSMRRVTGIRVHETTRPMGHRRRERGPGHLARSHHRGLRGSRGAARRQAPAAPGRARHDLDLTALAGTRCRPLRDVLRLYVPGQGKTDSELEAAFFELSHRAGLPTPILQCHLPGGRADFVYPSLRLVAECDGYDPHRGRIAFRDDRARDRANRRRGYDTIRFTWEDVQLAADSVVADLASEASRRSTVSSTRS